MSQHDFNIANQTAPNFRSDLNLALTALASLSSGGTAPSTTYANMLWYDTSANILKLRNEVNSGWISLGEVDQSAGEFNPTGGGLPAGAVQVFAMNTAPTGWLKCNGQAVSRTTYADLFSAVGTLYGTGDGSTTFNLPDLRGEFIRGADDGRGVDSGRGFGSSQADEFKAHKHGSGTLSNYSNTNGTYGSGGSLGLHSGISSGSQIATTSVGGTETRPRNIAMLYCIKT